VARRSRGPRIAALAAFPFPLALGSQIFVRDQLQALSGAGADVTLLCYGSGAGEAPPQLRLIRAPRALSATPLRAGPSLRKPLSDAALTATYIAAHRRRRFEVTLAHNVEAALAALAARRLTGVPVIYVAHTLLGHELPTWGPGRLRAALGALGHRLDGAIAGACDGVLALCEASAERLARCARGPVELIPPGLDPSAAPADAERTRSCERFGLPPQGFALYSGNLGRYQDLDWLARAARQLPDLPFVVATHAPLRGLPPGLRGVRPRDYAEMRALVHSAAVAVLPRRTPGGFPIKLLGYMEAAQAIVAVRGIADGLVHQASAWLLEPNATPEQLANAVRSLAGDPERARRLGRQARAQLISHHGSREVARRTLELVGRVRGSSVAAV